MAGSDAPGARPGRRRAAVVLALCLCLTLALAGCSHDKKPAASSPTSTTLQAEDQVACSTVETTVNQLAAVTAKWSPNNDPFSRKYQPRILHYANDLEVTAGMAQSDRVSTSIRQSALAFADLSTAMARHDRAAVQAAVTETNTEFAHLKQVCSL